MGINSKFGKKIVVLLIALTLMVGVASVAYAVSFGNSRNGASSVEVLQVKYDGAAWNYSGSGYRWASFKYTRNGRTLLTKTAYREMVRGSVWDDLIHWGPEYTTRFSWDRG